MGDMFTQDDVDTLRNYVAGGTEVIGDAPDGMVRLEITHSVLGGLGAGKSTNMFKNFPLDATIFEVKEIAHLHVGTSPEYMKLTLRDRAGSDKGMLLEDSLKLGFFGPKNGWILHVEDRDPMRTVAKYQDLSNLREEDKFKYTDEQYDKREGTLRQWLRKNPQAAAQLRSQTGQREPEAGAELMAQMKVGDRCKVTMSEGGTELGTVRYLGVLLKTHTHRYLLSDGFSESMGITAFVFFLCFYLEQEICSFVSLPCRQADSS